MKKIFLFLAIIIIVFNFRCLKASAVYGERWEIIDDATGGDCTQIGEWDFNNKTCTLTQDVNRRVVISRNNIVLKGDGHKITATKFEECLEIGDGERDNIVVDNVIIHGCYYGVTMEGIKNEISNSKIFDNEKGGIFFTSSTRHHIGCKVFDNEIFNNKNHGIHVHNTVGILIKNNTIAHNAGAGIYIDNWSHDNIIENNFIDSNVGGGIVITGELPVLRSWNNIIRYNTLYNGYVLGMYGGNNQVYNNNFINSGVSNPFNNVENFYQEYPVGGNYWSRFDEPSEGCNDVNEDGICDTPYIFSGGQDNLPWTTRDGWVVQNNAPTITLLGDNPLMFLVGKTFTDPGATAFDEEDGDISANIIIGGDVVNVDEAGTYIITYNVVDSGGVSAEEITRTVKVQTLAERAIELAKSVIGAPYLWGGKGWDYTNDEYVTSNIVLNGNYKYWRPTKDVNDKIDPLGGRYDNMGIGVDCSGLSLWSFNKGNDAKNYPKEIKDKKIIYCPDCPIGYEKANFQYRKNTNPISKENLLPGDLLFYNETQNINDVLSHVMLYAGNFEYEGAIYNVIHSMLSTGEISPAFFDVNNEILTTKGTDFKLKITAYGRLKKPDTDGIFWYVMQSPATMIITDPDGEVVSKDNLESVSMEYSSYDIDGDGEIEDMVMVALRKDGEYKIQVIPKENALPNDTFTLEIATFDSTIEIAKDIKISDIPEHGYTIKVLPDQIIPEMNVDIDIRPYSESNKIIFNSKKDFSVGLIPVAILSINTINTPKDINLGSLTFGKTGYENSLKHCLPAKIDVNKDGLIDLVCFFEAPKTELNQDDKFGALRGMTKTEEIFIGIDNIQIISPHFRHQ